MLPKKTMVVFFLFAVHLLKALVLKFDCYTLLLLVMRVFGSRSNKKKSDHLSHCF